MAKGRPSKSGKRTKSGKLSRAKDLLALASDEDKGFPNARILARRRLFSFVQLPASERQDGRNGEIDSEVCDAIGQFHALGLLNGNGHDPLEMRNMGRTWGNTLAFLVRGIGMKTAKFERASVTTKATLSTSKAEERWELIDSALTGFERSVLRMLIVDPLVGSYPDGRDFPFWAQSLIDEALLKRGRIPESPMCFPTGQDRFLLQATIRGLCMLMDASLPQPRSGIHQLAA